ncbi:hypothetical protein B0J12DRAFT_691006 [Macrophomina phaseolina]|uniref:Uncharacterized protein n=1 Tax=Macrophomina phaseolina TaxID=35725 RepID=A0ABQ8FRE5_9PEZI|nr:hypothetical protein B0J12DRAFT_691006 [Macrophomina phaseolina]
MEVASAPAPSSNNSRFVSNHRGIYACMTRQWDAAFSMCCGRRRRLGAEPMGSPRALSGRERQVGLRRDNDSRTTNTMRNGPRKPVGRFCAGATALIKGAAAGAQRAATKTHTDRPTDTLPTMTANCSCVLDTLRMLLRVEAAREQAAAALDTRLELAERCESRCLEMLACPRCRSQRFALLCATAVSTRTVQLLAREAGVGGVPLSIGGRPLDLTDAEPLLQELLSFQLDNFSSMQRALESVVGGLGDADRAACLDALRANVDQLRRLKARLAI